MKNPFVRLHETRWLPVVDAGIIILAISLFTLAVLPNVIGASAYFDEGYSAFLARFDLFTMAGYTALDVHPPLYYALLHIWRYIVGNNVAGLRMLSVIFGWVAIMFGFLVVRKGFGRQAGWLSAILMSLSPLFIRYGATMRMYTLTLVFGLAATYVLMHAVKAKSRWLWGLYAVLVSAGMWTNYFTALIWLTHLTWVLYEYRHSAREIVRRWSWAILWSIILYLAWLPALIFRYGEIQVSGFWIKPLSLDTLVSTVTMSLLFRNAASTTAWLVIGVVGLIVALTFIGRNVYRHLDKAQQQSFRLVGALAALPIVYLALISLPPLRSSYVYRYVLFASVATSLFIAIIVGYARFKRHDTAKRAILYTLTFVIFISGAIQATIIGNRNLDTDTQNKIGQVMHDIGTSGQVAPAVLRSPYSYYAAALYETPKQPIYYIFTDKLAKVGSTKPLYDHHEKGIANFKSLNRVWLVGEDHGSVLPPQGSWKELDQFIEYDDITHKPTAFATLYMRNP